MNKMNFRRYFITLGFLLFLSLLIPITSFPTKTAQASEIGKEKIVDYRLNLKSILLVKGKSFTLKAYNLSESAKVSFKSDDSEIASVNDDGTITANHVGVTIITATIKDGTNSTSLTCDVTVGPPAFSVKFTKSRLILGVEKTDLLRVILKPSNTAENARFSSYDPNIASISTGGRVTAKKVGFTYLFAEIDATNSDGMRKFAVSTIIVTSPEDAPLLETYFNEHPELDMLSVVDLNIALEEFFNKTLAQTDTQATQADKPSLTEALNQFLSKKFDLEAKRIEREEALAKAAQNQSEVISENLTK
ncbi:MAG: hypothetical protein K0S76_805 [Herbinix sp.]|jgi:hypothetical protein|nr:hypothetical protein [Herbinix sp.]